MRSAGAYQGPNTWSSKPPTTLRRLAIQRHLPLPFSSSCPSTPPQRCVDDVSAQHEPTIFGGSFDMAIQTQSFGRESAGASLVPATAWLKSLGQRVVNWAKTYADYYEAAASYEHLRCLSDTELQRRGLSRETLARDLCLNCRRPDRQ